MFEQLSDFWLQMDRSERWSVITATYAASIALFIWISYDFVGKNFVLWLQRKKRSLLVVAGIVAYSLIYWNFALPMLQAQEAESDVRAASPPPATPAAAPSPVAAVAAPVAPPASPADIESATALRVRSCTVNDPTGSPLNLRVRPRDTVLTTLLNGEKVQLDRTVEYNGRTWASVLHAQDNLRGWVLYDYLNCEP